jgi:TRAP-type mannitol/chloroaromatic compound transport system substrate-binding protein
MDRRSVITGGAAVGAAAAASTLSSPAIAQRRRRLKMVTTWPPDFPGLGTAANNAARFITEATDGELEIRVYAAGELVPAFESFDAVSTGAADMYHGADYYWQGKHPAFAFFTAVPFGLNANEMNSWIYYQGGQELWDELAGGFNIKPFICGNSGVQMGGWFNREINSVDDFSGLKIRMPGLGGEVLRRLGAAPVTLPGGEIFQSLQTGAIDATEWVGPWNDLAFGFYRVAQYYYGPGFHEPGAMLALGMNRNVWESLSPAHQAIVKQATAAADAYSLAEFNARNAGAMHELVDEHGVELRKFPDDVLREIGRASGEVLREVAGHDDISGRVYESFLAARRNGMAWGEWSEEGFAAMRRLDFDFE